MSRVLLHHLCSSFLVQFLLVAPLCTVHFQHSLDILQYVRTCPKYSVVETLISHVCRFPTHPFVGLLVSTACSLLSHSTDCQHTDSRIANPKHCHLPDVSRVFIAPVRVHSRNSFVRSSLSTKTPRIHLMFNLAPSSDGLRPQAHYSKWHNFSSVVLAPDRTKRRSLASFLLKVFYNPCTVSCHPAHQHMIRSNFCLVFHWDGFSKCRKLSLKYQIRSFSTSQPPFRVFWRCSHNQSCGLTPFDQSICHIKSVGLLTTF